MKKLTAILAVILIPAGLLFAQEGRETLILKEFTPGSGVEESLKQMVRESLLSKLAEGGGLSTSLKRKPARARMSTFSPPGE